MPQIGRLVRDVFEAQAYDERGDLVIESLGHRPVSFLLKGRGKDNNFVFTENITTFNTPYASQKVQSKISALNLLSARSDFSDFARIPRSVSFSHPLVHQEAGLVSLDSIVAHIEADFDYPVFVKPDDGSVGRDACSVYNREALVDALSSVFRGSKMALVQEKIEIDREYRCVHFNDRAYLLYDRMFKERGIVNGRAAEALISSIQVPVQHVDDDELWGISAQASQVISEAAGLKYFAADFVSDIHGELWFVEANTAPLISNAYIGDGAEQMNQMAADMIGYVRDYQ